MIKPIMRDPLFLGQKSEPAIEADKQVVQDLLDTLKANQDRCVGMAANMIGVRKNIIAVAAWGYSGWVAQIIQHELDHVTGIVI